MMPSPRRITTKCQLCWACHLICKKCRIQTRRNWPPVKSLPKQPKTLISQQISSRPQRDRSPKPSVRLFWPGLGRLPRRQSQPVWRLPNNLVRCWQQPCRQRGCFTINPTILVSLAVMQRKSQKLFLHNLIWSSASARGWRRIVLMAAN